MYVTIWQEISSKNKAKTKGGNVHFSEYDYKKGLKILKAGHVMEEENTHSPMHFGYRTIKHKLEA